MESLLTAQQEILGRIARTMENLKKSGSAKITSSLIASTLRAIDSKWEKFEKQHEQLRSLYWEEIKKHDYYINDFWGKTEEMYVHQRAALLEVDETLKATKERESALSTSTDAPAPPRTTLPRIQLPQFSGRYEDWPPFRDLFRSLIVKDSSISDVTRLHYLKASLKGEAESLVRSLPTTEENFS